LVQNVTAAGWFGNTFFEFEGRTEVFRLELFKVSKNDYRRIRIRNESRIEAVEKVCTKYIAVVLGQVVNSAHDYGIYSSRQTVRFDDESMSFYVGIV
jgi:hypothetical protein